MDLLLQNLSDQLEQLKTLFGQSCNRFSAHIKPTELEHERWQQLSEIVAEKVILTHNALLNVDDRRNLDIRLGFFRQLPRQMDSYSGYWSACYQNIRECMKKIHCLLIDIDEKYGFDN